MADQAGQAATCNRSPEFGGENPGGHAANRKQTAGDEMRCAAPFGCRSGGRRSANWIWNQASGTTFGGDVRRVRLARDSPVGTLFGRAGKAGRRFLHVNQQHDLHRFPARVTGRPEGVMSRIANEIFGGTPDKSAVSEDEPATAHS